MNKDSDNQKKTGKVLPNQTMLFLRGFIGGYLVYLAYELIRDEGPVSPRPVIIIFAILFVLAGGCLVAWVIRSFFRGEYIGGKADICIEEEEEN